MKLKKLISSSLVVGLIFNNTLTSFARTLSGDGRYEIFEGNNITIDNILEADRANVKIKGNSMVNLIDSSTISRIDLDTRILTATTETEKHFTLPYDGTLLRNGEKYTIILNVIENTMDEPKFEVSSYYYGFKETIRIPVNYTGIFKAVVTRDTSKENGRTGETRFYVGQHTKSQTIKIKDFMILEGDWLDKDAPSYFEGMKSSFEDNLVTQEIVNSGKEKAENLEKYKVEVKTTGKNIINLEDVSKELYVNDVSSKEIGNHKESIVYKNLDISNLKGNHRLSGTFKLNDVEYNLVILLHNIENIQNIHNASFAYLVNSGNGVQLQSNSILDLTDYKYMTITTGNIKVTDIGSYSINIENIQLESGNTVTQYEPYIESINRFYLNSSLLEGDTIEVINGQAYHVHKYNEINLDSNKTYGQILNNTYNNFTRYWLNTVYPLGITNSMPISNNFISSSSTGELNFNGVGIDGNGRILVNISNSKLSSQSVEGFKQWLSENPTTVIYKLANPIYEPIKADLSIQLFEETSHISNNSNIPIDMEIIIDRAINRAKEFVELAKLNPTVKNLSIARMWINLLKESSLKDEFSSEINNINNIEDLQLERKTATSNVDVYIKSENMLRMSLSTNSITFDNFSGVDDMELDNAINISINSSLPYQLNSYLLSEIESADKNNRIEKDLLNIKSSSDSNYKTFNNINEKLVLKDDCESGNNKSHSIDLKLKGSQAHVADIYKTVIKFEVEQK